MRLSFEYGTRTIEFDVEYRKRKTMEIGIKPPDLVRVVAPIGYSEDFIIERVKSKASWIVQKLFELKEVECKDIKKEYVDGELFMYLGIDYPLQIVMDHHIKKPEVKIYEGKLYITTHTKDESILKKAMEQWYRDKTLEEVLERASYFQHFFTMKPLQIKVKEQKKRWASCSSKRVLLFNWRCIMAPTPILDYIVVHEMCHMLHMNHAKVFWDLVQSIIPDHKERKEWLKKYGRQMHL